MIQRKPSQLKILVIEDNPGDARLVQEHILEHTGQEHEIVHVTTLAEAKEKLDSQFFNVALLDLGLPDAQDLVALQDLDSNYRDLPIIVISGHNDASMGEKAVEHGAQNYITKSELTGPLLARMIPYAIRRKEDQSRLKSYLTSGVKEALKHKPK